MSWASWSGGALLVAGFAIAAPAQDSAHDLQRVTWEAMSARSGTAVLISIDSGKVLASYKLEVAAHRLATPGSTIKPFTLLALFASGQFDPAQTILCRRSLTIAGKRMDCSHPQPPGPLDATAALAYSCNYYFATAAEHLTGEGLRQTFDRAGLLSPTGMVPEEAAGEFRAPANREQIQLLALGENGIAVTPLELLRAYRGLALRQVQGDRSQEWHVIWQGLRSSAEFGMGHAAQPAEFMVAGKTGTAGSSPTTHGWFVGYAPSDHPEIALVVYLEQGRGADAAAVAGKIFAAYRGARGAR